MGRIGLFGGSFNPAHEGHLAVSRHALRRLRLDRIWWMVSPQNPLKSTADMAPFAERLASATAMAAHDPRIHALGIEGMLGTRYTVDTLERLVARFRQAHFVFLMGADNFIQLPRWHRWVDLMHVVPVAVLPRPTYSLGAMLGKAAQRFHGERVSAAHAASLATRDLPAWCYLATPLHPASATEIRRAGTTAGRRAPFDGGPQSWKPPS